jgi:hypothetical protein
MAARGRGYVNADREPVVDTGVGWVEAADRIEAAATPMAETERPHAVSASSAVEAPEPPEPAPEPASVTQARDETLERLRAAGFLIGEPEPQSGRR